MEANEWAIRRTTTKAVLPKRFTSKESAEKFLGIREEKDRWKIVKRKVIYGEWEAEK